MNENDFFRLQHMLDAARESLEFSEGKSREDFEHDRQLIRALTTTISTVGEAASRISREFQLAHPDIPWPHIISMRNRLIHVYFDVNLDVMWETVTVSLPRLIVELEKLIPPENENQ